jgi:hypothetical protein
MAILLSASVAWAGARPRYTLTARVDAEARTVEGHARIVVENRGASPLPALYLWRYPERFATRSDALNDYNFWWVYPRTFDPGSMRTGPVTIDGRAAEVTVLDHPFAGPRTLLRVRPAQPILPREQVVLDVDFVTRVPARYGPFGCVRGTCTLAGGFYPMLADNTEAPPARGDYRVTVEVPRVSDVVVNGELHPVERGGRVTVELGEARAAALLVGRPRLRAVEADHLGVHIVYLTAAGPGVPSPPGAVLPYQPAERAWRVIAAAEEALDLLGEARLPMEPRTLRIVDGALRVELAQPLPGFVLASDELFEIFPLARFLKFHEFQLVRAIYDEWVDGRIAARERADDAGWAPDLVASWLVDLYTLRTYRKEEFARQILSWAGFIPAVDRILYAPQVPFASAYFYTLEDPDPLRDGLREFDNQRPRGKTAYVKLRDLVGDAGIERVVRRQLDGVPLREAAAEEYGSPLDWFWTQWLGPYPAVDYRFVEVRSERRGVRHFVAATVEKRGEDAPVEPVELRVRDRQGHTVTARWDGQGRRHTFELELAAPLSLIEIDPRGRLQERLPGNNDDLKFDDRRPARWKFIYNNFGGLVRVFPSLGIDLSLDFTLQRILDVKNSMRFLIYHTDATQIGVSGGYTRAFGRKITQARLAHAAAASLTVSRIDPSFGKAVAGAEHPGTQIGVGLGWGYDDRLFIWEPWRALTLSASAGYVLTVLDNARLLSQATVSAAWESIVPVADGQGFALTLAAGLTAGDLKIARQMLSSGGATGLRGYDVDELLGRAHLIARAEYRHVIVHDLHLNLLHSLYVRGIGGGVFAEAALTTACENYQVDKTSWAADVGYSLRVFADWFGVSQTTLNLDLAVPLLRYDRSCFGPLPTASQRLPFGFFIAFGPPW